MVVLAFLWAATEWTAWRLAFQPQLGPAWFMIWHWPIYQPLALFIWWWAVVMGGTTAALKDINDRLRQAEQR